MIKLVAIMSGGMDSATLAWEMLITIKNVNSLHLLTFNYGQRHVREIESAMALADALYKRFGAVKHNVIDLRDAGHFLTGSALTDDSVPVPHGHYEEESMRQTVVPNRNAIMLSVAWGVAAAEGADMLGVGVHAGDHFIYPDCRPKFISALEAALRLGTEGHRSTHLCFYTPFLHKTKADIAKIGASLGVPYELTWTCYDPQGDKHCGLCGACRERREAFQLAGVADPTVYEASYVPD